MNSDILHLLLGSALTLVGGWLSNWQTSKAARLAENRKFRTEKLEALASLVITTEDWIEQLRENLRADEVRHTPAEPMNQMYVLSELYFPKIWTEVHEFCHEARESSQAVRRDAQRHLQWKASGKRDDEALNNMLRQFEEEQLAIHKRLIEKKDRLVQALRKTTESL